MIGYKEYKAVKEYIYIYGKCQVLLSDSWINHNAVESHIVF